MRALVRLKAQADAAYDNAYHPKVRGRIWNSLAGTKFDTEHDMQEPTGFCYSNPFPWGDIDEGEIRHMLVSSAREELLAHVAAELLENPEFNIGEMPFTVEDLSERAPDVGEPGSRGTLETATGVLAKLPPEFCDDDESDQFWRPDDSVGAFKQYVEYQHDRRVAAFCPEGVDGPYEGDYDLFDGYELIKTFAVPIEVSVDAETGKTARNFVLSKWKLDYTVQSDEHRRALNLALDTGIGGRGELGLGFLVKEGEH